MNDKYYINERRTRYFLASFSEVRSEKAEDVAAS